MFSSFDDCRSTQVFVLCINAVFCNKSLNKVVVANKSYNLLHLFSRTAFHKKLFTSCNMSLLSVNALSSLSVSLAIFSTNIVSFLQTTKTASNLFTVCYSSSFRT